MNPIYFSLNMENLLSITNGEVPQILLLEPSNLYLLIMEEVAVP